MTTITNTRGEVVDLATGEIVGRTEGTPTVVAPREPTKADIATTGGDKLSGLLNNLSWGFNSMLFALPDAATKAIGRGLGMKEDDVFTLGRLFNKGEMPTRNAEERYARAVGEGIGGTMPFTGVLAWAARTRPMVTATTRAGEGVLKGIAKDAISFVQKNPRLAAALDVTFGSAYEGLRQAVKEEVSDENPNKQLYETLLPTAALVGMPMALNYMPSVMAGRAVKNKITSATAGLGEIEKDALAGVPGARFWKLPGVRIAPQLLMKNAEKKLAQVFGPISESPEAQQALRQLDQALADPRFAEAGFLFDASERTMYGPLLKRKAELLNQLGPTELDKTKARINDNQQKLKALFDSIAPESRQAVVEAFQAAQADRQQFFESLVRAQKDMTEAEIAALSERLGPQNMDMINNELRGALLSAMEFDYSMRKNTLNRMGLRQATSPEGLPMPTREEGKSLFPAQDMEEAAMKLIAKYTPDRPSARIPIPEPIQRLKSFVEIQQQTRNALENRVIKQLVNETVDKQIAGIGLPADFEESVRSQVMSLVYGKKTKGSRRLASLAESAKIGPGGQQSVPTGIPGKYVVINPQQIKADAELIARENTSVNINLPEALDYLAAASRYRTDSIARYNSAMGRGATRLTDAQRILDTGTAVFNDVEKLILEHVPKIAREYDAMRGVLSDYREGFEKSLPLMISGRKMRGEEFLLGNEQIMQRAFQNAENLRQLQITLGGIPQFDALLERGAIDWLRNKGVLSPEGVVDPKKIRAVLDKNRNILEALPEGLRTKLQNEVTVADDYVRRLGELDQRRLQAKNAELDTLLQKASRPDADPRQVLAKAIQDPATMRVLVDEFGKDPERLASLRRAVFDVATEGSVKGGALKSFLEQNQKSLQVLFKDTKHLDDLKILADLQARVNAFADVTGQIPVFESLDNSLKRVFGSGIQFLTTTMREAAVGRIAPSTGALALLVRLSAGLENELYKRIFTNALEDPKFAAQIVRVGTPQEAKKVAGQLQNIGIPASKIVPGVARAELIETERAIRGEEQIPVPGRAELPVVPRATARDMLRALPPAPPTTGTTFRMPTTPPPRPTPSLASMPMLYPQLFPNDPLGAMIEQRRQQLLNMQQR